MNWKTVKVQKVSDLDRIAKAERRVVRAAMNKTRPNPPKPARH